jgi:flagellar biosynthesis anti-sigma factor FlgM
MAIELYSIVGGRASHATAKETRTIATQQNESSTNNLASGDSVSLTNFSVHLNHAARAMAIGEMVDQTRVDAVKNAISAGEYHIDTRRAAENILALEIELPA